MSKQLELIAQNVIKDELELGISNRYSRITQAVQLHLAKLSTEQLQAKVAAVVQSSNELQHNDIESKHSLDILQKLLETQTPEDILKNTIITELVTYFDLQLLHIIKIGWDYRDTVCEKLCNLIGPNPLNILKSVSKTIESDKLANEKIESVQLELLARLDAAISASQRKKLQLAMNFPKDLPMLAEEAIWKEIILEYLNTKYSKEQITQHIISHMRNYIDSTQFTQFIKRLDLAPAVVQTKQASHIELREKKSSIPETVQVSRIRKLARNAKSIYNRLIHKTSANINP